MTFLAWIKHMADDAELDIDYGPFKQSMRELGATGDYETPMDVANDQEFWARANDIQQEGWQPKGFLSFDKGDEPERG